MFLKLMTKPFNSNHRSFQAPFSKILLIPTTFAFLLIFAKSASADTDIPFKITNELTTTRSQNIVTGFPFKDGVLQTNSSGALNCQLLSSSGSEIPYQIKDIILWPTKTSNAYVRVALTVFPVTVPPQSTANFTFHCGGVAPSASVSNPVSIISNDATRITVSTNATPNVTYKFNKNDGSLGIDLNGSTLVADGTGSNISIVSENGTSPYALSAPSSVNIVSQGPIETQISIKGTLLGNSDFKYELLYTLSAGKPEIEVSLDVINEGSPGAPNFSMSANDPAFYNQYIKFKSLAYEIKPLITGNKEIRYGSTSFSDSNALLELFQGRYPSQKDKEWNNAYFSIPAESTPNNQLDNLFTKRYLNGAEVPGSYLTDNRFDDVMDYRSTSLTGAGLALAMSDGWEKSPVAYTAGTDNGTSKLRMEPFPSIGDYLYPNRFDTAKPTINHYPGADPDWTNAAKLAEIIIPNSNTNHVILGADNFRFRMFISPHLNNVSATTLKAQYDQFDNRTFGKVDATYAASTNYLGYGQPIVGDVNWSTATPNLSYAMNFLDNFIKARAMDSAASSGFGASTSNPPKSCKTAQDQGLYFGGNKRFGCREYGSITYMSNGTSHYGVWEGMHLNLDNANRDLEKYYLSKIEWDLTVGRNWSTKKSANDVVPPRGVNKYESGHANNTSLWSVGSHSWLDQLLIYYFMTGDTKAKDAIISAGNYYASQTVPTNEYNVYGARIIARIIDMLLAAHDVTGDPTHVYENKILQHLTATKNASLLLQQAPYFAPPGAWINIYDSRNNPVYTNPPQNVVKSFMQLAFIHSVLKAILSLEIDDPSLVLFAEQMTTYVMNKGLKGGAFQNSNSNSYLPYGICYEFDPNGNCIDVLGAIIPYASDIQKNINNNYLANALSLLYKATGNNSYDTFNRTLLDEWSKFGYEGSVLVNPNLTSFYQQTTCNYSSMPFQVAKKGNEDVFAFGKAQATIYQGQAGIAERCDGIDNNGNGQTDENNLGTALKQSCYSGPAGTLNVGLCASGTKTCSNGNYGSCVGEILPQSEICGNGIDEDCNGSDQLCPGFASGSGASSPPPSGGYAAPDSPPTLVPGATGVILTPKRADGSAPTFKPSSSIKYLAFFRTPTGVTVTGTAKRCVQDVNDPVAIFNNCPGSTSSVTVTPQGVYVALTTSDLASQKTFYIGMKVVTSSGEIRTNIQPVTITSTPCTLSDTTTQNCGVSGVSNICQYGTQSCTTTSTGVNWGTCSSIMCSSNALAYTPAPTGYPNQMSMIINGTTYYPGANIRNLPVGSNITLRVTGGNSTSTSNVICYEGDYDLAGFTTTAIYPPGTTNTITTHAKQPTIFPLINSTSLGATMNVTTTVPASLTDPTNVLTMKCLVFSPSEIKDLGSVHHRFTN